MIFIMKTRSATQQVVAVVQQLTPAEIESLREDKRLALEILRVLRAIEEARLRSATLAEIEELETKLKALKIQEKANDPSGEN
jgi:hypothetical protein